MSSLDLVSRYTELKNRVTALEAKRLTWQAKKELLEQRRKKLAEDLKASGVVEEDFEKAKEFLEKRLGEDLDKLENEVAEAESQFNQLRSVTDVQEA